MFDLGYPFNVIAIYCQMFIIMCLTSKLNTNSFLTIKSNMIAIGKKRTTITDFLMIYDVIVTNCISFPHNSE